MDSSQEGRVLSSVVGSVLVHRDQRPPGGWTVPAMKLFRERLLSSDKPFPCVFGVDALRKGMLRLAFIPAGQSRVSRLAQALCEFTEVASLLGRRTSLVSIFEPDPRLDSLEKHREHFWSLLTELCEQDAAPWPDGISTDPNDSTWEFSYNSMPMFVVANSPHYRRRKSRYFENFAITFQPRFVFEDLQGFTRLGDNARTVIRRRLAEYDDVEPTPLLGSFGVDGNKEWTQYFLSDDNEPLDPAARCPISQARARD